MLTRLILRNRSGKGVRLLAPASLPLQAVTLGAVLSAATVAAAARPASRGAGGIPAAPPPSSMPAPLRGTRTPDPATRAAINPVIPLAIVRPVPVPPDPSGPAPDSGWVAGDGIVRGNRAGSRAALGIIGGLLDGMPGGAPGGLLGEPFYAGFDRVSDPVLIASSRIRPRYPTLAREAGIQGQVVLRAVVRKDGTVGEITVLRGPGARLGFERAAVDAVRRWKYKPGLQNGKPVDVHFEIVVDFDLPQ